MSLAPMSLPKARWGYRMALTGIGELTDLMVFDGLYEIFYGYHMGLTAENIAEKYSITRKEQDELGVLSHNRARKAVLDGTFAEEIVPVVIKSRKGETIVDTDDAPFAIEATAETGYEFVCWKGDVESDSANITVNMSNDTSILAEFRQADIYTSTIVINEINFNSNNNFDPDDWIELYNGTPQPVDISNWIFKDSNDQHSFIIPDNTILQNDNYLVLCRNDSLFNSLFSDVDNYLGDFDFALSNSGDILRLYDSNNVIQDSVHYNDNYLWPVSADGGGKTLSLLNPLMDNSLPESWEASLGFGTPGEINDIYVDINSYVSVPSRPTLYNNFPNPFNPTTSFKFAVPSQSLVKIKIYNLKGRLVKGLVKEYFNKGIYTRFWNGTDSNNRNVASGIYLYQLSVNGKAVQSKRMVLVK
jgi:hypothetical protein